MQSLIDDPHGLLEAWRQGEAQAAFPLSDHLEEIGNPDDLPLAGFRELAARDKVPFAGPPLATIPDEYAWRDREGDGFDHAVVWTWLLAGEHASDPWSLPRRAIDALCIRRHEALEFYSPDELAEWIDEEPEAGSETHYRYELNASLLEPFGDRASVRISPARCVVEVATFPLAVTLAGLGFEIAKGMRTIPGESDGR